MRLVAVGAVNAAVSVGAGAFAAHGLKGHISDQMLATFETGARYHMYHALAIVFCGVLAARVTGAAAAGWIFQLGIVLFSGSLYALALSGQEWIGVFTPFGGVAFLVGWVWLAWSALKSSAA